MNINCKPKIKLVSTIPHYIHNTIVLTKQKKEKSLKYRLILKELQFFFIQTCA